MIRRCVENDFEAIYNVINDAAKAYKNIIPSTCYSEPYMSREKLRREIESGVIFYAYELNSEVLAVMGLQHVENISLIRHAYVRTDHQRQGLGGKLLAYLLKQTSKPILVGTWLKATWAINFYLKHGFTQLPVGEKKKNKLLKNYWEILEIQIENSTVLADQKWLNEKNKNKHNL